MEMILSYLERNGILIILFALFAVFYYLNNKKIIASSHTQQSKFQTYLDIAFPSDLREFKKFSFLRMVFGILLTVKSALMWIYVLPQDLASISYLIGLFSITVFSIFIALGFLSSFSLLGIIAIYFGEPFLRNSTLGNDIAAILSFLLLFAQSYRYYSLDSLLANKCKVSNFISLNHLFTHNRKGSKIFMARAKFIAVFSYGAMCVYFGILHFNSPSWLSGEASFLLLSSSYLSSKWEIYRELFQNPFVVEFNRYAMFLMFPWYFLFVPAFFIGGFIKKAVMTWWFIFLCLSMFVLQLGFLSHFEFVFFTALLLSITKSEKRVIFYYDSKCNLCQRTLKVIKFFDIAKAVSFVSARSAETHIKENGYTLEDALMYLVGEKDGKFVKGYDLYMAISKNILLLMPFYPILYLFKFIGGYKVYQTIANNRFKFAGHCEIPPKAKQVAHVNSSHSFAKVFTWSLMSTMLFVISIFWLTPPIGDVYESNYFKLVKPFYRSTDVLGVNQINVFNKTDLSMSENWRTVEYCYDDTQNCDLIPLTGHSGERLEYHKSDSLYYGGTLKWRRMVLDEAYNKCDYGNDSYASTQFLHDIVSLYETKEELNGGFGVVTYYKQKLPRVDGNKFIENSAEILCKIEII